jgi:predicted PurR-regulated permease PerM
MKISLSRTLQILLVIALIVAILYLGKSILIPLAFASVISMLLLPVAEWLHSKKFPYWLSVTLSVLFFMIITAGILSLIAWQVSMMVKDSGDIEKKAMEQITSFQQFIQQKFGINVQQQSNIASGKAGKEAGSYISTAVTKLIAGAGSFFANSVLFIVYTFLLLLYKDHLKAFLLKAFFTDKNNKSLQVLSKCRQVATKYVANLGLMIAILCIMYSIGFSIVGVKNAILFAMLASVLETIPFVGNLAGTLLTILMTIVQGGSTGMVIGVVVTYFMVQFIQTYFLETLIVGESVNINPLVTIAGPTVGELIWGIPGMVLTIPILGISKIVFDNIPRLQPVGFLMGKIENKKSKKK